MGDEMGLQCETSFNVNILEQLGMTGFAQGQAYERLRRLSAKPENPIPPDLRIL